jgi:hypothetical protein
MAYSCLSLSISHNVTVVCNSYAIIHICCWMTLLPVLCYRLNKYLAYLVITAHLTLKSRLSRSDMVSRHCWHMGSS